MAEVKGSPEEVDTVESTYSQPLEILKDIGLEPAQLKKYIKAAIRLRELEKQYGKSYQVLLREYEKKFKETVKLEYSIGELLEKRRKIEEDLLMYMKQHDLTLETINKVAAILNSLKKYSVDVEALESLAKVAAKISETGTDFKQVYQKFEKLDEAERRLVEVETRYNQVAENLRRAEEELEAHRKKIDELVSWTPEVESLVALRNKLMAEVNELEQKTTELRQKLEQLTKEYEALYGFKTDSQNLFRMIEEKKNELRKLDEEIAHKRETLELLEEEMTSARSLLMLLQNPELVRKDDLESLSRQFANLANIKAGEMPALKTLEPSLMENVRKRVVELVMPVIRTDLVPRWVFERLEKEFKEAVAKKTQLEEEIEKLKAEVGLKSSRASTGEQQVTQQVRQFKLLKKGSYLNSDSGIKIKLRCIYCQNHTIMVLPIREDLEDAAAARDPLVTTCSSCGREISVEAGFLLERFFKG
ncbi:MAG: hypothetical protein RMI49_00420 [Candidatus Caldarchaeum sp.]|nr:hypothetical protein [Candidatus Caldarchaeum sp.]